MEKRPPDNLDWTPRRMSEIPYYICAILSFVPALVIHEVSHGFAAYKLGDPTAKRAGRLSLNPLKHIDPFGTVILPLLMMILNWPIFGYAKPVPYNPTYFKDPRKGDFITGIAGPLSNLCMALIACGIAWALQGVSLPTELVRNTVFQYFYFLFLPMFCLVNLYLMFFNLIPIPPLDGSSIIALFIPVRLLPKWYSIQHYAFPVLMIAIIVLPYVLNVNPIWPIFCSHSKSHRSQKCV
jgi:Zn-dependent protease